MKSALAIALLGRRTLMQVANETEARIVSPGERGRVVILIARAATLDPERDVAAMALSNLDAAAAKSFDDLAGDTAEWWHDFWQRNTIALHSADETYNLYLCTPWEIRHFPDWPDEYEVPDMRWTLMLVLAFASVAAAQQPPSLTAAAAGRRHLGRDGDRIIVDDDARIQIVRRRQATLRTIYSKADQLLIVLVDYSKPGEFPDGQVDWAFNFYQVEGPWPLGQRWEGLTVMYQYEGDPPSPEGTRL